MSYIIGIDVSNNNGSIDFSKVANDGVQYVYVKATEGATFKDSYMDSFYNGCKSNGLKVGAYHFLVKTSTPESQAQNFYEKIKDYTWDLVPMLDVETNFDDLSNYIIRFISAFKKLCSLELGIYSYTSFISNFSAAQDIIKDMKFWEANYNNNPWNLANTFFTNRIGHQYTESASISGVSGHCDKNSFTEGVLLGNSATANGWISKDGKWYYSGGTDGAMATGWQKINEKWYFFDTNGVMQTGWQKNNEKWYFLDAGGAMQIGWQKVNEKWYFFNTSGVMQTGWIKDNGKNYYLSTSGELICNCNKFGYSFDSHGVATKASFLSLILNMLSSIIKNHHK